MRWPQLFGPNSFDINLLLSIPRQSKWMQNFFFEYFHFWYESVWHEYIAYQLILVVSYKDMTLKFSFIFYILEFYVIRCLLIMNRTMWKIESLYSQRNVICDIVNVLRRNTYLFRSSVWFFSLFIIQKIRFTKIHVNSFFFPSSFIRLIESGVVNRLDSFLLSN